MLLRKGKVPLYYQLAENIIKDIEMKGLKEDDKLPAEREYCERYKLSRSTVRQAIDYLEKKGYIYKVQGSGTFVSEKRLKKKALTFYSLADEIKRQGKNSESKILSFRKIGAADKVSKELSIEKDEKVLELTRIRLVDGEKIMYEESYFPLKKFKNLTRKDLKFNTIYDISKKDESLNLTRAVERFLVERADKKTAKNLSILEGTPVIKFQRWIYSGVEVIEYTISSVRGDRFRFEVELKDEKYNRL